MQGSIPLSTSIMYYRPQKIIGLHYLDSIPLVASLKDPQPSLTAESQLSLGNDFSGIYFRCTTRALTLTWCTQGGVDRRQVGAGPLSSNLLSQVTDPPKIVKADFTMLSENPRAGRESFDKSSAHGKFWPSHHSPARPPRLSPLWRLYWNFNTFTMLVRFWKRQIRPQQGHLNNHLEGRPNFPTSAALKTTLCCQVQYIISRSGYADCYQRERRD